MKNSDPNWAPTAVIETVSGPITGRREHGCEAYLGIPFAKLDQRWGDPQPVTRWSETMAADHYGSISLQNNAPFEPLQDDFGSTPRSEDCLNLNVFTPTGDGRKRPVMVWIHGGGFATGSGTTPVYRGHRLARDHQVVVVTINYRLGVFGFLRLTDFTDGKIPATGNEGLKDQIAALRWVQGNIERFGGDPEQVTVFGESAGAMSIAALLTMPSAAGLFRRAILQSGAGHHTSTARQANRVAAHFLDLLEGTNPKTLRSMPQEALLRAQQRFLSRVAREHRLGMLPLRPVVDGVEVPELPIEHIKKHGVQVDSVMIGVTKDEWGLFSGWDPSYPKMTRESVVKRLTYRLPGIDVEALIDAYHSNANGAAVLGETGAVYSALLSELAFRLPFSRLVDRLSHNHDQVYVYRWDWESAARDGALGAIHASELAFIFGNLDAPGADLFNGSGPQAEALAKRAMAYWANFAKSGKPSDASHWPVYENATKQVMTLGAEDALISDPWGQYDGLWQGLDDQVLQRF